MSMFDRALKQLDAIFPQFSIKPPIKKAIIRSIIQEIEVPSFSTNNLSLLKNSETAKKILEKLNIIFNTWLKILENNEKARQQHHSKQLNNRSIEKLQYMYAECAQVSNKSDFFMVVQNIGGEIFQSGDGPSLNQYKEIYIYNSLESYSTITMINQDQYFQLLEELTERLSIYERMTKGAMKKLNELDDFYELMRNQELFKKKNNALNQIINYNVVRTMQLSKSIQKNQKILYSLQQNLVFSLARCYYLCYMSIQDIEKYHDDDLKLAEIRAFLCDRGESVFPKLYHGNINKPLIKLDKIHQQFMNRKYDEEDLFQKENKIKRIFENKNVIEQKIEKVQNPLTESQFLILFEELAILFSESNINDERIKQLRHDLSKLQGKLVQNFIGKQNQRRYLSKNQMKRPTAVEKNNKNRFSVPLQTHENFRDNVEDIFPIVKQINLEEQQVVNRVQQLSKNPNNIQDQCLSCFGQIKQQYGSVFEDDKNFNMKKIMIALEAARINNNNSPEVKALQLEKSILKPELSEKELHKIFFPRVRGGAFQIFLQKLIEHQYKIAKVVSSAEYASFPTQLKNFLIQRETYVKNIAKKTESLKEIVNVLSSIRLQPPLYVGNQKTYDEFLKLVLAQKQVKYSRLEFQDEKLPKSVKIFINQTIYDSLRKSIEKFIVQCFGSQKINLEILLGQVQFYTDFVQDSDQLIDKFLLTYETQKETREMTKSQLQRILKKWVNEAKSNLDKKNNAFEYEMPEKQLQKLLQIIKVCEIGKRAEGINDEKAKKLLKMI